MKDGRIGTLGADDGKLDRIITERHPRKVWTFITPKGMKGKIQLISSMWIVGERPESFVPKLKYNLFYDAASPKSVFFTNSGSPEKIEEVSAYFNNRFNAAFRSNFQGEKGVQEMEADVVRGFEALVRDYETCQFLEGLKK